MAKSNQSLLHVIVFLFTMISACVSTSIEVPPTSAITPAITSADTLPAYWVPSLSDSLQWQLSDYPVDISINADIFELDLFETPQETIDSLHESGKKVICYINVGAWEEYRPDAGDFPNAFIGKKYVGWDGERWLDISNYESFSSLISARFDHAVSKGCDGIDPDNINGFQHDTGFSISAQDQLVYNIWLSEQAHLRGLSIGLKNDSDQVSNLVDHFDFAILEDCAVYGWCADFQPFIEQGKAVFQVEYTDNSSTLDVFCEISRRNHFFGLLKNRSLDTWFDICPSAYTKN
jgi:hypothetical protein